MIGKELSASTGDGKDAFYSNSGWISKPDDKDPWLQYTNDDKSYKLWGLSTWGVGAGDETGLWVTEYWLEFQSKYDENRWYPYKEGKSNEVYYFSGNIDPFSEKHHNLKDSFTFNVLRIRSGIQLQTATYHVIPGPAGSGAYIPESGQNIGIHLMEMISDQLV